MPELTLSEALDMLPTIVTGIKQKTIPSIFSVQESLQLSLAMKNGVETLSPRQKVSVHQLCQKYLQRHNAVLQQDARSETNVEVFGKIVIQSPYNVDFIAAVKTFQNARWDTTNKVWTIPWTKSNLAQLEVLHGQFTFKTQCEEEASVDPISWAEAHVEIRLVKPGIMAITSVYHPWIVEDIRKLPGARWNKEKKRWEVPITFVGQKLFIKFCRKWHGMIDSAVDRAIHHQENQWKKAHALSIAKEGAAVDIPLSLTLRGFQHVGVQYAMQAKRCIIGDEPGVGKTAQALATVEGKNAYPAIVVAPKAMKLIWQAEIAQWLPHRTSAVLPGKQFATADFIIVNYENLSALSAALVGVKPKAVIFDESHYLKNGKAKRTQAAKKLVKAIDIRLLLSGTPATNRPAEFVSQLDILGRIQEFGGKEYFLRRYCNAHRTQFGWDFKGASNTLELNDALRSICYIRREKSDVLTELPPKVRAIVPIELSNDSAYRQAEKEVGEWLRSKVQLENIGEDLSLEAQEEFVVEKIQQSSRAERLVQTGILRQCVAEGKMNAIVEWVKSFQESGQKLVLFAYYHATQDALVQHFPECVHITYRDSSAEQQAALKRFQEDPSAQLMVASQEIAGTGLTMHAASNVGMVELLWTPAALDQCEDRLHRQGQLSNVTVWYFLGQQTIDTDMWAMLEYKRQMLHEVTTGQRGISVNTIEDDVTVLTGIFQHQQGLREKK